MTTYTLQLHPPRSAVSGTLAMLPAHHGPNPPQRSHPLDALKRGPPHRFTQLEAAVLALLVVRQLLSVWQAITALFNTIIPPREAVSMGFGEIWFVHRGQAPLSPPEQDAYLPPPTNTILTLMTLTAPSASHPPRDRFQSYRTVGTLS